MDKALRLIHTFAASAVVLSLCGMPEGLDQAKAAELSHAPKAWPDDIRPEPSPDPAPEQIAPRVTDPDEAAAPGSGWLMTNLLQPEPPWPAAMDLDATALADRSPEDADDEAATIPVPAYSVQLGALGSPADAHAEWERLSLRLPDLFAGREPDVRLADVSNARFWALRTGPFASFDEAAAFCARLRVAGISCWTPPAGS
jgi:hypothetical protein